MQEVSTQKYISQVMHYFHHILNCQFSDHVNTELTALHSRMEHKT